MVESKQTYYLLSTEHDLKIIGHYPQISLKKGYNPKKNGHWEVPHNDFPSFQPNLELILHSKAQRTYYMHFGDLSNGFLVSEKLKNTLSSFTLPKHKFYPIKIFQNKELLNYFWFYYVIDNFWNKLDKQKSYAELVTVDNLDKIPEKVSVLSREQILTEKRKNKFPFKLRTGKIVLRDGTPKYDFYQIQCLGYQKVFSQIVFDKFKDENISGFELNLYMRFML